MVRKELIEYQVWLRRTSVFGRIRSPQLKRVDELLKNYELNGGDLGLLRIALQTWKLKEGVAWKSSKRNADGAIEELERRMNADNAPVTVLSQDATHARLGLIYLFAHTKVDSAIFKLLVEGGFDLAGNVVGLDPVANALGKTGAPLATMGVKAAKFVASESIPAPPNGPPLSASLPVKSMWEKLVDWLSDYARKVYANLNAKYASGGMTAVAGDAWGPVTSLIKLIVGKCAAAAAPFVGGAFDLVTGLKNVITGCYDRYASWSAGRNVVLTSGHPAVVVDSIHRAMNFSIAKGVYDSLKGAGSLAMAATSFGASAVVDMVIAGCEVIASFIHRVWETSRMNAFFGDCRERWKSRAEDSGIQNSPTAFAGWYRAGAVSMPAVSALALNSGITGDKMQYLKMFDDGGAAVKQAEFDRGTKYLEELKKWSREYVSDTGYKFFSDDKLIASILAGSTSKDFKPLTVITGPLIGAPTGGDLGSYSGATLSLADAQVKFRGTG